MRKTDGSCSFPAPALPDGQPFCCPAASLLPAQAVADKGGHDHRPPAACRHAEVAPIREFLVEQPGPGDGVPALLSSRSAFDDAAGDPAEAACTPACTGAPTAAADAPCSNGSICEQTADNGRRLGSSAERYGGGGAGCSEQGKGGARQGARPGFHWVPDVVIQQWGEVLDIVQPLNQRCNCFTKTYSSYIKAQPSLVLSSFIVRGIHPP